MTVTGAINIDYSENRNTNDIVAAFVNGTCRGVAKPIYIAQLDRYIVFLLIYGDIANEEIEFQVYDAGLDEVRAIENNMMFRVNGIVGSSVAPYIWSDPTLSNEANILSYDFGVPNSSVVFKGDSILVEVPYLTDTTQLTAQFTTSPQAYVRIGDSLQVSGITTNNFSSVVRYHLQSADETTTRTYYVKVSVEDASPSNLFLLDSTLLETSAKGTLVGVFEVEDPDGVGINTVTLTSNAATDNNKFKILQGKLYTNVLFDYETQQQHTIEAEVTNELGLSLIKSFAVYIIDENDEAPIMENDTVYLPEDLSLPTLVHTIKVSDRDSSAAFKKHTFILKVGNEDARFSLDKKTGSIYLINPLDYESSTLIYELEFQVSDGVFTSEGSIIFYVEDVNDGVPIITTATISVLESSAIGTEVHKVVATDVDANSELSYSITGGNTGNVFSINDSTGLITLVDSLDYETTTNYLLEVAVSDGLNASVAYFPVNVIDVNDEYPLVAVDTVQLSENAITGQIAHIINSTDPDENSRLRYAITNGNVGQAFTINPGYGIITVLQPVDYEKLERYFLEVTVDDGGLKTVVIIVVEVVNENDEKPELISDSIYIDESHFQMAYVGRAVGIDIDDLTNLTYSITGGNTKSAFSIDKTTGVITLDSILDYEKLARYNLEITVDDEVDQATGIISVFLNNLNDEFPVVSSQTVSVSEASLLGIEVANIVATDSDELEDLIYRIDSGNEEDRFTIDSTTGIITLENQLDYETIISYDLAISVFDGLNTSYGNVIVNVINANDEPPVVEDLEITISEDLRVGFQLDTLVVSDKDGKIEGLYFSLLNPNGAFKFSVDPTYGFIQLREALDYETDTIHKFEVKVSDGTLYSIGTVTVNVLDVNDNPPSLARDSSYVDETIELGTVVYTALGADVDQNPVLRYSYTGLYKEIFSIDSLSGEISVTAALDYETKRFYDLKITVDDNKYQATGIVRILLNNLNDEFPVVNSQTVSVSEASLLGVKVTNIVAIDSDQLGGLFYHIDSGNEEDRFAIDTTTGIITLKNLLDYETVTNYDLAISVFDGLQTSFGNIIVNVINSNDEPPVAEDLEITIPENLRVGFQLDTFVVTDADGGSGGLYFSLVNPNSIFNFSIDANYGFVRLTESLDYEKDTIYQFEVKVSDGALYSTAMVTVNIVDVNDNAPSLARDSSFVDETVEIGSVVHTAIAQDLDRNSVIRYSYTGTYKDIFSIDSLSGEIILVAALDYETKRSYELNVVVSDTLFQSKGKVLIYLNDINDEFPQLKDTSITVSEFTESGTFLLELSATDKDENSLLSYALLSENELFDLSSDGVLDLLGSLDFETAEQHPLLIEVFDGINTSTDTITILVGDENEKLVDFDNTFSPNGDGVNDYWYVKNPQNYNTCSFVIFNQYGHEVYTSTGYNNDWDGTMNGKPLPVGTYYYVIDCPDCPCTHSGFISLIK